MPDTINCNFIASVNFMILLRKNFVDSSISRLYMSILLLYKILHIILFILLFFLLWNIWYIYSIYIYPFSNLAIWNLYATTCHLFPFEFALQHMIVSLYRHYRMVIIYALEKLTLKSLELFNNVLKNPVWERQQLKRAHWHIVQWFAHCNDILHIYVYTYVHINI